MRWLPAASALTLVAACVPPSVRSNVDRDVAPRIDAPWTPPEEARAQAITLPSAPRSGAVLSLPELLAYALAHNPSTRIAFEQARVAAASAGSARAAWFPSIDVTVTGGYQKQSLGGGRLSLTNLSWGPSASLTWLLFDLGGRSASIEAAQQTLYAANFAHDQTLQDVMLRVEQSYYQYEAAKALLASARATEAEAKQNEEAAEARKAQGVATIADVLQAKTALSQAQLNRQSAQGQVAAWHGQLAAALGLSASAQFEVGELPEPGATQPIEKNVDALIAQAEAGRPDLARSRALAKAAEANVGVVRSRGLPTIGVAANAGRSFFPDSPTHHGDNLGATLTLTIPIFDGFKDSYDLAGAEAQAASAKAQVDSAAQAVALQVWTSYQSAQTAEAQLSTARDFLASATQNLEVAEGRYRQGVGTIIDVLNAQAALASARAQEVSARTSWLLSLASLAHDIGALEPSGSAQQGAGQG